MGPTTTILVALGEELHTDERGKAARAAARTGVWTTVAGSLILVRLGVDNIFHHLLTFG